MLQLILLIIHATAAFSVNSRLLSESFNRTRTMSNMCKKHCIDDGYIFCLNDNQDGGVCCSPKEVSKSECPKTKYCSDNNPRAPNFFKYFTCPNEPECESRNITPRADGTVLTRAVRKYSEGKELDNLNEFLLDDVCSYVIAPPLGLREDDKLMVKFTKIEKTDVMITMGKTYKWLNHLDYWVSKGDQFEVDAPFKFYVVGVSTSVFKGSYEFKTWIEKGD